MEQKMYMISDAAKQVEVESHVLRYWEDELELPIKRNKLGHRYYTQDDVNRLKRVKTMKEQGFQLKAIRKALKQEIEGSQDETQDMMSGMQEESTERREKNEVAVPVKGTGVIRKETAPVRDREEKAYRLQMLLRNMIVDTIREENEIFCEQIKESVLKELDYQFRLQAEREDERENERVKREEEHFRQIDELIREKAGKKEKRKQHSFF